MISAHILSRQATRPGQQHRVPRFTTHSTSLLIQRSLGRGLLPVSHGRTTRAWESTTTTSSSTASTGSHKESGHIDTAPHESLLFFNSKSTIAYISHLLSPKTNTKQTSSPSNSALSSSGDHGQAKTSSNASNKGPFTSSTPLD